MEKHGVVGVATVEAAAPLAQLRGPLTKHLRRWHVILTPDDSLRPARLLVRLLGSKLWLLTVSVAPLTMLLGTMLRAETLFGATDAIIYTSCFYSSATGNGVLVFRRQRILAVLEALHAVAVTMEAQACRDGQHALRSAGGFIQRLTNVQLTFAALDLVAAWAQIALTVQPLAPMWPALPGYWGHIFECNFQGIVETTGTFAYMSLIVILGCMTLSLVGLYHAVALRLREARGRAQVLFFVRLHQRLLLQANEVEALFYDVLGHMMVVTFVAPLLSTLKVLLSNLDATLFNSLLLFSVVFGPLAAMSQALSDASLALGDCAYQAAAAQDQGDYLLQRDLLVVAAVAVARPPRLSIKGFGAVSVPGAASTLRIWYQWANMIVGITTKEAK